MVMVVTGLCDFLKTTVDKIEHGSAVPNYQIISPIVLLLSAVSVCARASVCVCVCMYCVFCCVRPYMLPIH